MDFNDTPAEAAFREEANAFLRQHAELRKPGRARRFIEEDNPNAIKEAQAWQATKKDNGWACLTWPVEYGGRGAKPIEAVIWNQEEAKFDTPPNMFSIGLGMLGPTMMAHGTQEQKDRYLEPMARGDEIWCQLFSEPAAGSDLAGLRTSATRDGDDWLINGQKIWTSGAHYCKWGMIVTRTDPNVPKHDGLTYFIVDMEAPGIEIRPIKQISGSSNFNEVFFSDVRVPDSYRVGEVGDGWRVSITTLMNERATLGSGDYGPSTDNLIALARRVEIDGRPAIENPEVRQRIAEFHVKLAGSKHVGNRIITAFSKGATPGPEASIGKLVTAPLGQELASFAVDLMGMAGSDMDAVSGYQDTYLSAPGIRLAGGTDEILHNIVAERVLRLPPEPRVDKDIPFRDVPSGSLGG